MATKTNRLPAGIWQPPGSPAVHLCRANEQSIYNCDKRKTQSDKVRAAIKQRKRRFNTWHFVSFLIFFFSLAKWQFWPGAVSVCLQCGDNTKYVHCKICCSGGNKQAEQAEILRMAALRTSKHAVTTPSSSATRHFLPRLLSCVSCIIVSRIRKENTRQPTDTVGVRKWRREAGRSKPAQS